MKICFLPKIHKRLSNVPGRRVISICRTPTKKASEFLYYHLKPVMQTSWYYIKDSEDFIEKIKKTSNTPDGANLVTADVVGLYLSIPHELGLKAFTDESSRKNVIFLDVDVKFWNGQIITDLHIEATDRHQYLHYTSSHPHHIQRSIVYSQALRVSQICLVEGDYERHRTK